MSSVSEISSPVRRLRSGVRRGRRRTASRPPRPARLTVLLAAFLIMSASGPAAGMGRRPPDPPYAPGELLVAFYETVPGDRVREIVRLEGGTVDRAMEGKNIYLILLPEGTDVPEAARRFSSRPEVRHAEPNYRANYLEKK